MVKLVLAVKYIAVFALIVAILLIVVRAKFPVEDDSPGMIAYLRAVWSKIRERHADKQERAANLRVLKGKTALLVDPDAKSARVMSWRLESLKCKTLSAAKGSTGINLAKANEIDFVIVDALLNDISAESFYSALERTDIPVIYIGVLDSHYDELRRLGRNTRCFQKPYEPDEVLASAGNILRR